MQHIEDDLSIGALSSFTRLKPGADRQAPGGRFMSHNTKHTILQLILGVGIFINIALFHHFALESPKAKQERTLREDKAKTEQAFKELEQWQP